MSLENPDPDAARQLGLAAVGAAAGLLLTVAILGKRIASHSREIEEALEAVRDRTDVLLDIPKLNFTLDGITRELRVLRKEAEA